MPISACEYCGKPISNIAARLCAGCSKEIEDTYVKARRYIYQNSKNCDFVSIIEATEVPEKALSYLINKGRIMIADRTSSDRKCRACGKETESGSICQQCMGKILKEKLASHQEKKESDRTCIPEGRKKVIPTSHGN